MIPEFTGTRYSIERSVAEFDAILFGNLTAIYLEPPNGKDFTPGDEFTIHECTEEARTGSNLLARVTWITDQRDYTWMPQPYVVLCIKWLRVWVFSSQSLIENKDVHGQKD